MQFLESSSKHQLPSLDQCHNKKGPLMKIIMLSFISIFVVIAMLGSVNGGYYHSSTPKPQYGLHRKLQQDITLLDLEAGGFFGLGIIHPKELAACHTSMEHHVPCYNISFKDENGAIHDRFCDLSESRRNCLIPPPKGYTLPLSWPHSRHAVWNSNLMRPQSSKGSVTERMTLTESNMLLLHAENRNENFQRIATIVGISGGASTDHLKIRKVLFIGCRDGSFADNLILNNIIPLCIAPYEHGNSQVQLSLERGFPAMIGSLGSKQLPFSTAVFDVVHCTDGQIDWTEDDRILLLEVDRLLSPNGYFVWHDSETEGKYKAMAEAAKRMCWTLVHHEDHIFVWRKTLDGCSLLSVDICNDNNEDGNIAYKRLQHCRQIPKDITLPPFQELNSYPSVSGFSTDELVDSSATWLKTLKGYWSEMTPLLFSDHPKRPAEDDPLPPPNVFRNVMDMNALYGGFNTAILEAGKHVWVMNVVPTAGPDTLPIIYKRGFIGTLHNWCEAFPTYPRTYDLLHAVGLLTLQREAGCSMSMLLLEMDRILRPEGWVLLRDTAELIEDARIAAIQMRWEARIIQVDSDDNLHLLVCQKVFWQG